MFFMPGLSLEDTEDTEAVVVARELWRSYYDDGGGWWLWWYFRHECRHGEPTIPVTRVYVEIFSSE